MVVYQSVKIKSVCVTWRFTVIAGLSPSESEARLAPSKPVQFLSLSSNDKPKHKHI